MDNRNSKPPNNRFKGPPLAIASATWGKPDTPTQSNKSLVQQSSPQCDVIPKTIVDSSSGSCSSVSRYWTPFSPIQGSTTRAIVSPIGVDFQSWGNYHTGHDAHSHEVAHARKNGHELFIKDTIGDSALRSPIYSGRTNDHWSQSSVVTDQATSSCDVSSVSSNAAIFSPDSRCHNSPLKSTDPSPKRGTNGIKSSPGTQYLRDAQLSTHNTITADYQKASVWIEELDARALRQALREPGAYFEEAYPDSFLDFAALNPDFYQMPFGTRVVNIKTDYPKNIVLSIKHGRYSVMGRVAERIMGLAKPSSDATGKVLFLVSINGSRRYSGLAELSGAWDKNAPLVEGWETGRESQPCVGTLPVRWLFAKDVPFTDFDHLRQPHNGHPVGNMWNGMNFEDNLGRQVLEIYIKAPTISTILGTLKNINDSPDSSRDTQSLAVIPTRNRRHGNKTQRPGNGNGNGRAAGNSQALMPANSSTIIRDANRSVAPCRKELESPLASKDVARQRASQWQVNRHVADSDVPPAYNIRDQIDAVDAAAKNDAMKPKQQQQQGMQMEVSLQPSTPPRDGPGQSPKEPVTGALSVGPSSTTGNRLSVQMWASGAQPAWSLGPSTTIRGSSLKPLGSVEFETTPTKRSSHETSSSYLTVARSAPAEKAKPLLSASTSNTDARKTWLKADLHRIDAQAFEVADEFSRSKMPQYRRDYLQATLTYLHRCKEALNAEIAALNHQSSTPPAQHPLTPRTRAVYQDDLFASHVLTPPMRHASAGQPLHSAVYNPLSPSWASK